MMFAPCSRKAILDGFQAGLSWITILRKRDNFRRPSTVFEPAKIARYKPAKIEKLMADEGIVRNRQKVEGAVLGPAWLKIGKDRLLNFLWKFVDGVPYRQAARSQRHQAEDGDIAKMSKALKDRLQICGPTIVYAFMQATGMVNDHLVDCHCHAYAARRFHQR